MLPVSKDILNTVAFFQTTFSIVIALSIGEAFKQFVADKADKPEDRAIHWDRLPALLAFLLLALPFFHGMNRYFFLAYTNADTVPQTYGLYLIFDGISFMSMSALFFAMSRSLPAVQWRRFFCLTLLLLFVDSVWIAVAVESRGFPVLLWQVLNAILAITLVALLARDPEKPALFVTACAFTTAATTTVSYIAKWAVFFPH
ncbi:hypothetical protein [Bradyrhizobium sp. B120]|uniref:hypothetical protein n=1 Tax=Bradyrhizobium sp. B120 TaxID=3410088 RepID=UPI003B983E89